jgi:hypothetical protein
MSSTQISDPFLVGYAHILFCHEFDDKNKSRSLEYLEWETNITPHRQQAPRAEQK